MSKKKLIIINGPNLNLLGVREPNIYGEKGFEGYLNDLKKIYPMVDIAYFQSNIEGELIEKLQEVGFSMDGILLNAGGYTHTSVAILDAIKAIESPVVEIHISNTAARESFRHHSMIASACIGSIGGFGLNSYRLGVESFF